MDSALRTTLLFCISVILSSSVWVNGDQKCEQSNACRCIVPGGKAINLESLATTDKKPKFNETFNDTDAFVLYNPCKPFNGIEDCQEAAVCLQEKGNVSGMEYSTIFGKQDNPEWTLGEPNKISYKYFNRRFVVDLKCNETGGSDHSFDIIAISGSTVEARLTSKCACPGGCVSNDSPSEAHKSGLSTGSVILIIFFSLVIVYLLGGIIYNKVVNGATGKELIPNVEFWSAFPRLVLDGLAFTCNCCGKRRTSPGYDNV